MFTPACKVFAAFENIQHCAESPGLERLLAGIPVKTDDTMFDFSLFWQEESWARAVAAATDADIIIVSLSGHMDLPVPVRRWMESLPHYDPPGRVALIVAFENPPSDASMQPALTTYCQQLADAHGLSFFCKRGDVKSLPAELPRFESQPLDLVPATAG